MKISRKLSISLVLLTLVLSGCTKKVTNSETGGQTTSKVFVVNANPETIGVYDVIDETYRDNVLLAGTTPNYMFEHNALLYLVNSGFGGEPTIQTIDPVEEKVVNEITLPNGSNPMRALIVDQKNGQLLLVTSWTHHLVYVIDLTSGAIIDSIHVGKSPDGITELNNSVFVAATFYNQESYSVDTGKLYKIDSDSMVLLDSAVVGINPGTVINDGEYLYVGGGDAFAPFGYIAKYSPQTLEQVSYVDLSDAPTSILPVGDYLWVSVYSQKLYKIRKQDLSIVTQFDLSDSLPEGAGLMGMDTDNDGKTLYIAAFLWSGDNYLLIFDTSSEKLVKSVYTGPDQGTQIVKYFSQ